jgi:hypothetical protein
MMNLGETKIFHLWQHLTLQLGEDTITPGFRDQSIKQAPGTHRKDSQEENEQRFDSTREEAKWPGRKKKKKRKQERCLTSGDLRKMQTKPE